MVRYTMYFLLGFATIAFSCGDSSKQKAQQETTNEPSVEASQEVEETPVILFFGNSITAGYQLDVKDAFPAIIQERLDSLGYTYKVVNAGLSGETSAGGLNRIEWVLQTVPDIFVLELGANDGLRGLDLDETKKNLKGIIEKVREANPEVKVVLAGMQVPPNLGNEYTGKFQKMFQKIADESNTELIPFLLEGVAGNPDLNLSDGIHPTPEGHQIVTENVWPILKPLLEKEPNS